MDDNNLKINACENYLKKRNPKDIQEYINIKSIECLIRNAIKFISINTKYNEEELYKILNENVHNIQIVNNFRRDKVNGIAHMDVRTKTMRFRNDLFEHKLNVLNFQKIVTHELIHALSNRKIKLGLFKTLCETGYEAVLMKTFSRNAYIKNKAFNEALVETLASKGIPYQTRRFMGYSIYSNLETPSYAIISNLVNQMFIANEITNEEWIDGLFNKESCEKVLNSFEENNFRKISKNMHEIFELSSIVGMNEIVFFEKQNIGDKINVRALQDYENVKKEVKECIGNTERLIIDNILLPKLRGKTSEDKNVLLKKYQKFIISERDYFEKKVGNSFDESDDRTCMKINYQKKAKEYVIDDNNDLQLGDR
ncbi:MAG: hypothetical protein E7313_07785 [Clostridiales bacterium]|nr:hypothetical protein [Clostridiales bacterium]